MLIVVLIYNVIAAREFVKDIIECYNSTLVDPNEKKYDMFININIQFESSINKIAINLVDKIHNIVKERYALRGYHSFISMDVYEDVLDHIISTLSYAKVKKESFDNTIVEIFKDNRKIGICRRYFKFKKTKKKVDLVKCELNISAIVNNNFFRQVLYGKYIFMSGKPCRVGNLMAFEEDGKICYKIIELPNDIFIRAYRSALEYSDRNIVVPERYKNEFCNMIASMEKTIDIYCSNNKFIKIYNKLKEKGGKVKSDNFNIINTVSNIKNRFRSRKRLSKTRNDTSALQILNHMNDNFSEKISTSDEIFYGNFVSFKLKKKIVQEYDIILKFFRNICNIYKKEYHDKTHVVNFLLSVPDAVYDMIVSKILEKRDTIIYIIFIDIIRNMKYLISSKVSIHQKIHLDNDKNKELQADNNITPESIYEIFGSTQLNIKSMLINSLCSKDYSLLWFLYKIISDLFIMNEESKKKYIWLENEQDIRNTATEWFMMIESLYKTSMRNAVDRILNGKSSLNTSENSCSADHGERSTASNLSRNKKLNSITTSNNVIIPEKENEVLLKQYIQLFGTYIDSGLHLKGLKYQPRQFAYEIIEYLNTINKELFVSEEEFNNWFGDYIENDPEIRNILMSYKRPNLIQ